MADIAAKNVEMIERVAKAMADAVNDNFDAMSNYYLKIAIAAIKAMHEPTPEMLNVAGVIKGGAYHSAYCEMIDAALGEHK